MIGTTEMRRHIHCNTCMSTHVTTIYREHEHYMSAPSTWSLSWNVLTVASKEFQSTVRMTAAVLSSDPSSSNSVQMETYAARPRTHPRAADAPDASLIHIQEVSFEQFRNNSTYYADLLNSQQHLCIIIRCFRSHMLRFEPQSR